MIKSILLGISLVFSSSVGFSQSGYTIIENLNNINVTEFNNSLQKCNFDVYRMYGQNRILKFDNGVTIALTSGEKIISGGQIIKITALTQDSQPVEHPVMFHIDYNGNVLQRHANSDPKAIKMTQSKQN